MNEIDRAGTARTTQEQYAWEDCEIPDQIIKECYWCGEIFNVEELDGDCPYCKEEEDEL